MRNYQAPYEVGLRLPKGKNALLSQPGSAVFFHCLLLRTKTKSFLRLQPGKGLEMKKTYLVKKDPKKPQGEDNWIVMNAFEFHEFMKTEEGKRRRQDFGQMDGYGKDDTIIIAECGKETARKWRAEKDCKDYAKEKNKQTTYFCNSPMCLSDFSRNRAQDILYSDECYNMEEEVWDRLELEKLCAAVKNLSPVEKKLIAELFYKERSKSEEEIGKMFGVGRQTIRSFRKLTLEKLRNCIENGLT